MVLSNSEIRCFQRCPREHEYRFVADRQALIPAAALATGSRIHAAIAGTELPPDAPVLEHALIAGYRARWKGSNLKITRRNVAWTATIAGVEMAGEFDAIGEQDGRTLIVEHKTSGENIEPGSAYWRRIVNVDPQASTYLAAAQAIGIHAYAVVWDVLRKPLLRGRAKETEEELFARAVGDMAERPDFYFQRAVVVRLEAEREAFEADLASAARMIETCPRPAPRNPDACMRFGRECDFFEVCSGNVGLDDDTRFTARTYRRAT